MLSVLLLWEVVGGCMPSLPISPCFYGVLHRVLLIALVAYVATPVVLGLSALLLFCSECDILHTAQIMEALLCLFLTLFTSYLLVDNRIS